MWTTSIRFLVSVTVTDEYNRPTKETILLVQMQ